VKDPPCSALEYHQFDFWLGDWDAFDIDKPDVVVARTKITSILNGCAVLEEYDQSDGMHGRSFSIYDATRKVWHQTWVTNNGRLLVIEGCFESGTMILAGIDHPAGQAQERHIRGIWKPESGGVRETAQTSSDGGKTWQPWFDIFFRKQQP
jgi:DICT domain-containing protein